jgi:two-component system alkaline phosphatase synthesis response regulator PhoP
MGTTRHDPATGTVLVVDDDRDALDILKRNLEHAGYTTITAGSGQACLDAVSAQSSAIDVILLDVMMPGMDGLRVCEELKRIERAAGIPVILVTAKDDLGTRAAGMRLGVSEFVTKPLNMQELQIRLRNQLHARRIRAQLDDANRKIDTLTRDGRKH